MKLQRAKTAITGIAAALLLSIGMFTTPALADGYSNGHANGKGKQGHYLQQRNRLPHHRGNRSSNNYYQKRDRRHQSWGQTRQRSHGNRHFSDRRHQAQRRHYSNRRHNSQHRGHSTYRGNDLLGAVVGGAIIYHLIKR